MSDKAAKAKAAKIYNSSIKGTKRKPVTRKSK